MEIEEIWNLYDATATDLEEERLEAFKRSPN